MIYQRLLFEFFFAYEILEDIAVYGEYEFEMLGEFVGIHIKRIRVVYFRCIFANRIQEFM